MDSSLPVLGLQVAGAVSVTIGIGHIFFHRLFGWHREFARISALNAKVFTTIHVAATLLLLALGLLTLRYAALLAQPVEVALVVCLCLGLFWLWRLVWQVLYFHPSKIAHNRGFLLLHYALILLFAALAIGYGLPLAAAVGVGGHGQ